MHFHKYHAKKTVVDGITFSSQKEAKRYGELKLLQRCKKIFDLELQPRFLLQPAFKHGNESIRKIEYVADFSYRVGSGNEGETGYRVVEDVKGMKTEAYKIKRKLFLFKYGNEYAFQEI